MIGWWLAAEMLQRYSPWMVPNLLATSFYGERAYGSGFASSTWSGLALPLAVYSGAGILFALLGRERKSGAVVVLAGAVFGVLLDWFFFGLVLRRMNPMVHIYSPDRLILASHLIYGIALGSYPGFASGLVPPPEPQPSELNQEVGGGIAQSSDESSAGPVPFQEATPVPGTSADQDA